jgi:hypothetical protein
MVREGAFFAYKKGKYGRIIDTNRKKVYNSKLQYLSHIFRVERRVSYNIPFVDGIPRPTRNSSIFSPKEGIMNTRICGIIVVLTSLLLGGCATNPALFRAKAEQETVRGGNGLIEAMADTVSCGTGALLESAVLDAASRGSRRSYSRDSVVTRSYQDCTRQIERQRLEERRIAAMQQAVTRMHCERDLVTGKIGSCREVVDQTTFGGAAPRNPNWVPR